MVTARARLHSEGKRLVVVARAAAQKPQTHNRVGASAPGPSDMEEARSSRILSPFQVDGPRGGDVPVGEVCVLARASADQSTSQANDPSDELSKCVVTSGAILLRHVNITCERSALAQVLRG
jgi:hypothetical protein